jgi:hypothetical protein
MKLGIQEITLKALIRPWATASTASLPMKAPGCDRRQKRGHSLEGRGQGNPGLRPLAAFLVLQITTDPDLKVLAHLACIQDKIDAEKAAKGGVS